jgi:hypothetical protein
MRDHPLPPGPRPGPPPASDDAAWDDEPPRSLRDRLLRPWFAPRPGELRGAVVLLSGALALTLALWFDASRRPSSAPAAVVPVAVRCPVWASMNFVHRVSSACWFATSAATVKVVMPVFSRLTT